MEAIPLVDLSLQHAAIDEEVRAGFERVLKSGEFILGPEVAEFEKAYATYCNAGHCVTVANGTDALELALRATGVGTGAEVVIPANTFAATAFAVLRAGSTPVLVDVDEDSLLLDAGLASDRITSRTRAIVPVHLFGQIAPMEAVMEIAGDRCVVIEDAAQSHGALRNGRTPGSWGLAAATSFYPAKNLGAYGDGGAVTTNDDDVAALLAMMRNQGSRSKYEHAVVGCNSRLDTLQAVVLNAKLRRIDEWTSQRRMLAARYDTAMNGLDVTRVQTLTGNEHAFHLYVIRVPNRDAVLEQLHEAGIGAGIHYPVPLHLQPAFASLGHQEGDFPVTERAAQEILSLPLYPGMTEAQQDRVINALTAAL